MHMHRSARAILALIIAGAFAACSTSSSDGGGDPEYAITSIDYYFQNHDPDYLSSSDATCALSVYTYFDGNLTASDIKMVTLTSPSGGYWLYDDDAGNFETNRFDSANSCIESYLCYRSADPHRMPTGTYTVTIELNSGKKQSKTFMVSGPDEISGGYLYTEDYTGTPVSDDVAAIERAETLSAAWSGNTLTIDLDISDARATNGYLWFYDSNGDYIGRSQLFFENETTARALYDDSTKTVTINDAADLNDFTDVGAIAAFRPIYINAEYDSGTGIWYYANRSVGAYETPSGTYTASIKANQTRAIVADNASDDAFAPPDGEARMQDSIY